ncbi:hypothetical protein BKA67DRAFT_533000 [Truncatella angustata]|uniref:DUF3752 domain-containing protein n=1 Tax=Truncatella angustata TaxID=152316 RepID=A0A9P8UTC5_9PEZI|nr:uncharacterized protein BKA67DRAFT_533000 [Truncatella angustata]KAH6657811.1 hypothetical protein BKA67DRAFT_533000 [Truncatella angustata]
MPSIRPQLPPHLTKRKRHDGETNAPPPKRASTNQEEIALDGESSEDEYGPSVPRASLPSANDHTKAPIGPSIGPAIGPSIGPTLPPANTNEITLDDSDSDSDTGPAPAPTSRPTQAPAPAAPKRVLGPAPPPAPLSERPPAGSDSDDSDDDYGPSLPTSNTHLARQSQALEAAALEAASGPKAPQRDDWMVTPPTAGGPRAADPTKIKARKFNSGPRASASGGGGGAAGEISSIWTETPEQKRQRLENAVLGRGAGAQSGGSNHGGSSDRLSKEQDAKAEQIRANLEAARGPSLYAEHQRREGGKGGRIEEEEDDPSKRGFDWEKDMRSGGKIGTAQRKELMNKASDFGGRFSKGKYL